MKGLRISLAAGAALAAMGGITPVLAGVGLHWYQGQLPTVTRSESTVTASGEVGGAGQYITAVLKVYYSYPVSCYNPGSDSGPVPGQSQNGSASTTQQVQANHGNASFSLQETVAIPAPPASACPNPAWHATAGPLTITSADVTVTSDNGGYLTYTKTF